MTSAEAETSFFHSFTLLVYFSVFLCHSIKPRRAIIEAAVSCLFPAGSHDYYGS